MFKPRTWPEAYLCRDGCEPALGNHFNEQADIRDYGRKDCTWISSFCFCAPVTFSRTSARFIIWFNAANPLLIQVILNTVHQIKVSEKAGVITAHGPMPTIQLFIV